MRLAGQLLLACVVLTALKALVVGLLLTLGTTLVVGLIYRPMATIRAAMTILATLFFIGHPLLCLFVVASVAASAYFLTKPRSH